MGADGQETITFSFMEMTNGKQDYAVSNVIWCGVIHRTKDGEFRCEYPNNLAPVMADGGERWA